MIRTKRGPSPDFFGDQTDPPPTLGFVPVITRAAPVVGRLVRGVISLAGFNSLQDTQPLEDMIGGRSRVRIKARPRNDDDDNKHVVKVSDAVECVEEAFNSEDMTAELVEIFLKTLVEGNLGQVLQKVADRITDCIRSKELQQSNPKMRDESLGYRRVK